MSTISCEIDIYNSSLENVYKQTMKLKNISMTFIPKIDLYIFVLKNCLYIKNGIIHDKYIDESSLDKLLSEFLSNIHSCKEKIDAKFAEVNQQNQKNIQSPRKSGIFDFFRSSESSSPKRSSVRNLLSQCDMTHSSVSLNDLLIEENNNLNSLIKQISSYISNCKIECSNNTSIQQVEILNIANFPLEVDSNGPFEKPHDPLYGGDFKSKLALKFKIPNLNVTNKIFKHIEVNCICSDQNWGGTGQCNVRYFINDKWFGSAFYINREKVLDKTYIFNIKKEDIKMGDIVSIWLCCPGWNGWKVSMNSIHVELKYD
jgi:hypothetical protein